jgi:TIGR03009 family protein
MNRIRGRILGHVWKLGLLSAWFFMGEIAAAQPPEQHWQATQNYSPNYGPNYQPGTASSGGNPAPAAPAAGQYQYQPPQPANSQSQQYPPADYRPATPAGSPQYGPPAQPDNRQGYPQNPAGPAAAGLGPISPGQTIQGSPIQGPPAQPATPQVPFLLSQPEINALNNLLTDWEKRNREIHVLESKFYHWKYDAVFGNAKKPSPYDVGELKFAAPDKAWMKIDAKDPKQSEQWLCDGKSVFHWDYTNNVVTEYIMPPEMQGKGIGDGPLPFVFGIDAQKLKQRYFMRIITPRNVQNEVWLEAYPKFQADAANYYKVEVILQIVGEERTLFPYAIQIYAPNGKDRIVYQLQNPVINPRRPIIEILGADPWKPSIPFSWRKDTRLPDSPAPQASGNPAMLQRR